MMISLCWYRILSLKTIKTVMTIFWMLLRSNLSCGVIPGLDFFFPTQMTPTTPEVFLSCMPILRGTK